MLNYSVAELSDGEKITWYDLNLIFFEMFSSLEEGV